MTEEQLKKQFEVYIAELYLRVTNANPKLNMYEVLYETWKAGFTNASAKTNQSSISLLDSTNFKHRRN